MRRILVPLVTLAFLAIPACGDSGPTGPASWDVSGQWSGTLSGVSMSMSLNENADGNIAGNGNFSGSSDSFAFDVSGSHVDENVNLTISATGFEDFNYSATLEDEDQMEGELNGSGFTGETLTLVRN